MTKDAVLMSVHPGPCEDILSGRKCLEGRGENPYVFYNTVAYLYKTRPISAIVGKCVLHGYIGTVDKDGEMSTIINNNIVEDPLGGLCLSKEDLPRYIGKRQSLALFRISEPVRFKTEMPFSILTGRKPPMSYFYLHGWEVDRIEMLADSEILGV